ncbi:MAG: enolase C-terminal domain-like protein [Planctomycetota bacterium]
MLLRLVESSLRVLRCRTRLPFRFGAVTMRSAWLAALVVTVEDSEGRRVEGRSGDLLVPRWFDKDPAKSPARGAADLAAAVRIAAAQAAADAEFRPPFDLWDRMDRKTRLAGVAPALVASFGVALVERAMLDAAARLSDLPYVRMLREVELGFDAGRLDPALAGTSLRDLVAPQPRVDVAVRHTIGLADALRETDRESREDDGLPASLEQDVLRYGLDHFKIKIGAGVEADAARLGRIGELLRDLGVAAPRVTLDGNEQYDDPGRILELLDRIERHPAARVLREGLLYVEQPVSREATFARSAEAALRELGRRVPVIIDEADGDRDSFRRALDRGYRGVSVKNCKGVFRSLLNRALVRAVPGARLAGEDLTNLADAPLHQTLVTAGALDLDHLELNGHHYFRGLDHLGSSAATTLLAAHPDLYRPLGAGAALRIRGGRLRFASLHRAGFGALGPLPAGRWRDASTWGPAEFAS